MEREYEDPRVEIVQFDADDIIRTSCSEEFCAGEDCDFEGEWA